MRTFWLVIFLSGFFNSIQAQYSRIYQNYLQPQINRTRLTTHPQNDFDPAVSPDGNWLVFVSDRSGNRDLWVKSTHGGRAFQITRHKAADYSPCWAPNNRTIYFISTRSDAEGDLWQIELNPGKLPDTDVELRQIDTYLGYDNDPFCFPDGRFIAITTTRLSGKRNIWIIDPGSENVVPFTFSGGESPCWSPDGKWIVYSRFLTGDKEPQSDLFFKRFNREEIFSGFGLGDNSIQITDSKQQETFPVLGQSDHSYVLFFLRHEFDSNGDHISNVEDIPSLISVQLDSATLDSLHAVLKSGVPIEPLKLSAENHLNSVEKYLLHPFVANDEIYFTSLENDQYDIEKIPANSSIPLFKTAGEQYAWADSVFNLEFLCQLEIDADSAFIKAEKKYGNGFFARRQLAFQTVRERFPKDLPWSILAGLEIAGEFVRSGENLRAFHLYRELLEEVKTKDPLQVRISLDLWRARGVDLKQVENSVKKLFDLFQSNPSVLAEMQLFLARQYCKENNFNKALGFTKNIIDISPHVGSPYFEALKLRADIFLQRGNPGKAINQYLQILINAQSGYWQQLGCKKIITILLANRGNQNPAIAIQNAILKYASLPGLASELLVWLGEYFWQNQDPGLALRELDRIGQNFKEQKVTNLKAGIITAAIYGENQQQEKAILTYRQLLKRPDLTRQEVSFLQARIWNFQFEQAERQRRERKFLPAYNLYRQLVTVNPQHLEAQRGLVRCANKLDKLPLLENDYEKLSDQNPDNEYFLYVLGLIYSIKFENDVKGIIQSNQYLKKALNKNPQLVYGYLTLSSNYERLELYQKEFLERKRSWIVRASRTLFAPVIWLYRTVTLRKAAKFQNWYEQAIELLQLAISLNDEREFPQLEALLCFNLANDYYQMGEFGHEKAYEFYLKKMKFDSTFSGSDQEAVFYHRLGHSAISVGDWQTAKSSMGKAIVLYNQLGDVEQVQAVKKLLALNYQLSGDSKKAIETLKSALPADKAQKNQKELLETYRNIAYNHLLLENTEEVRQYCLKALEILKEKKIKNLQRPSTAIRLEFLGYSIPLWSLGNLGPSAARSLYGFSLEDERALIYTILAQNAANQKDFLQAMEFMKEKLAVFRKLDDVLGRAIVQNNIGMIHIALGNYQDAWNWFKSSQKTCRNENFLSGEIVNILNMSQLFFVLEPSEPDFSKNGSFVLNRLNETLEKIADYPYLFRRERVDLLHQKALLSFASLKKNITADSSLTPGLLIPNYIKKYAEFSDLVDAFIEAADLARQNAFFRSQTIIWKNLGELFRFMDLMPEARQYYKKGLSLAKENDFTDLEWRLLVALGNSIPIRDIPADSQRLDYLNKARQILVNETIYYPDKAFALSSQADREQVYFSLIENRCEQGNFRQALLLAEEYQALQKLAQLRRVEFSFGDEYRKNQAGNYLFYLKEINRLEKRVGEIKRSRRGGYRLFYQVIDSLAILKSEFTDLVLEMKENDPELLSLFRPLDFSLEDVQLHINGRQALLSFFCDTNNLYAWCVTSDTLTFHKTDISRLELTNRINRFNIDVRFDSLFPQAGAHFFYEILLQPFITLLDKKTELSIVDENPFSNLPFEILINREVPPAKRYLINYFPTLTDFYLSFFTNNLPGRKLSWLGTPPDFINEKKLSDYQVTEVNFSSLTESKFLSELNQADYLVINRPLVFIKQPVLQSHFHLQPPKSGQPQTHTMVSPFSKEKDGYFHLSDLFKQNSNALFVFLLYPEDSLASFISAGSVIQTAWRNAGIPAYVTLRWPVPFDIKNEFVYYFLREIKENRLIDAFFYAQKELRKKYNDPAIWGAFVWRGFPGPAPEKKGAR